MRCRASRFESAACAALGALLLAAAARGAAPPTFQVAGDEATAWPKILSSIGMSPSAGGSASVYVLPAGTPASPAAWLERIAQGAIVVLEGESALASHLGFQPSGKPQPVRSVIDTHRPALSIIWEKPADVRPFRVPPEAKVFCRERWNDIPLVAGLRPGQGAVLWLALSPGDSGYERFPYLLQALHALGLPVPVRGNRLWAFFDSSYRTRADLDYFAVRWRQAGIATLHVAAWHYFEPDPQRDQYLRRLIDASHRNGITVYAWLELPHVSEGFWQQRPECREKTALLQDAHLDWRKLINLLDPSCADAVKQGTHALLDRFDWDGVNLAELYFESLEGAANAARFTPMNANVRRMFQQAHGFDPLHLFSDSAAPAGGLEKLLAFRAELARRMQEEWIQELETVRRRKPHLDLVLTHVDDRFDSRMRDLIGADAARLLPLLDRHDFTFLIEDPATIWHLGPQRYPEIARRYEALTRHTTKLAIDINVVERYQDVYPTKRQTGIELFQLVNLAAKAFARVALYFESSILKEDLALLPAAAAGVSRLERAGNRTIVESPWGAGVPVDAPPLVHGKPWPVWDGATAWVPPGVQVVEPSTLGAPPLRLLYLNATLTAASAQPRGLQFAYQSSSRALAIIDRLPARIEIDGAPARLEATAAARGQLLRLPRGQHLVTLSLD